MRKHRRLVLPELKVKVKGKKMMGKNRCVDSVLDAIGNTPLIRLNRLAKSILPMVLVKFEAMNPGGSVKDRVGVAMVLDAEKRGHLRPGGTIIEATAGNTGVGLALVAAVKGYRSIFVMPDKMSPDKIRLLKAYGAEVVITPTNVPPDSPESYNGVADRLAREIPGAWRPNQFANLLNPEAHFQSTGPEIWDQTQGRVTVFVAGAGTGGTLSGVGRFLKEKNPAIRVVGADPEGSVLSGGTPGAYTVEGIGEDYIPKTLNAQVIDEWIRVSDAESFDVARRLAREEGILAGGSSGTALAAALRFSQRLAKEDVVVVLCPDTGRNYLGRMFNEDWMAEHGFINLVRKKIAVGNVVSRKKVQPLFFVSPEDSLVKAIGIMREKGFSQIPVVENSRSAGAIHEVTVAKFLYGGGDPTHISVKQVMAKSLPVIDVDVDIEEVYRLLLSGHSGVLVKENEKVFSILTRADLIEVWTQKGADNHAL